MGMNKDRDKGTDQNMGPAHRCIKARLLMTIQMQRTIRVTLRSVVKNGMVSACNVFTLVSISSYLYCTLQSNTVMATDKECQRMVQWCIDPLKPVRAVQMVRKTNLVLKVVDP